LSQEEPVVPTNTDHTSKQFDVELEALRARVLKMGGLVEEQIKLALEGLMTGDVDLCDKVEENDHKVNALEVGIDEDVSSIIARRQPAASDLRMLMTVVKTITDLERIGDEADKIARMAKLIYTDDRLQLPRFARLDLPASAEVVRQDRNVDEEFRSILRQLITFMMEDPRNISLCIEILFIAKAIERIGDHAKNISEYVVYMVKGKDVRHVSLEEIEREVLS
jgi:phosphate transport system protein